MKRALLPIFVLSTFSAAAQYVFPSFSDGVSWSIHQAGSHAPYSRIHEFSYDTMFCGQIYSAVVFDYEQFSETLFFRSDSQKVYLRHNFNMWWNPNMDCSLPEQVVYDFGLDVGDSIFIGWAFEEWMKVINKGDTIINGTKRQTLTLIPPPNNIIDGGFTWIQGIGTSTAPWYFRDSKDGLDHKTWTLNCMDSSGTLIYNRFSCERQLYVGAEDETNHVKKNLIQTLDHMGNPTNQETNKLLFKVYNDGTIEKEIIIK